MYFGSLKTSFTIFIVIFTMIFVGMSGYFFRNMASENISERIMQKNMSISKFVSNQIEMYLANAIEAVETAAAFSSESNGDLELIQNEIFRMYDNFSYFDLIFFMDDTGKIQFSKPANPEVTEVNVYRFRDYYIDVMRTRETAVSRLFLSTILSKPHFVLAAPVFSDGELIGLIGGGIPIENIKKIIQINQEEFDGNIWVFDSYGSLAVDPYESEISTIKIMENSIIEKNGKVHDYISLIDKQESFFGTRKIDYGVYNVASSFVESTGWMVMVEQSVGSFISETDAFNKQLRNFMFVIIILSIIIGIIFSNSITKPIEILVKDVEKIGSENYHIETENLDYYDEVRELRTAFHQMGNRIDKQISDLEISNENVKNLKRRLSDVLESFFSAVVVCDKFGEINFANKAVEMVTGYSKEEIIGLKLNEFYEKISVNPDNINSKNPENIVTTFETEIEIKSKNSGIVPVSLSFSPLKKEGGERTGIIIGIRDLKEVKYLEEELKREDRIRTLGELSASIIHDIGNPLAGMSNLIEILKEDYVEEESKKEVLGIMEKEVADLNKMVIEFLDFTKKKGIKKEKISLNQVVLEVVNLFKVEAKKRQISISINDSSKKIFVNIDRLDVKQAIMNIFKNSLYAVEDKGTIRIDINEDSDKIALIIADDGVGIEKDKMNKIFDPFFTTKESGTGLGLPIAYKSIKANGGYLTVRSIKGRGTEFTILFPK
ncbi:PAS domain S-box-containing protein [Acetoanaerobium pronyense]|uniref:histidine kinase n=1 Tax=Acetoanaerobium pronyense TaxID=1482736 RepID=A0ABS4KES9_9FIRM|nr:ATP-binding protein [Acetoanaerobium pronyense]MBP2026275.1 PAS domain S-box-containing protein [Acetoanaerobium pronyense]